MLIPFRSSKAQEEDQSPNAPFHGHNEIDTSQSVAQDDTYEISHPDPENPHRKQGSKSSEVSISCRP